MVNVLLQKINNTFTVCH